MNIKNIALLTALTASMMSGFAQEQKQEIAASDMNSNQMHYSKNGQRNSSSMTNMQDDMYGFRLQGEALYWKTTIDDQPYTVRRAGDETVVPINSTKQMVSFDWNWGYRITGGYQFCERDWGIFLQFLQLKGKANNSVNAPSAGVLIMPANIELAGYIDPLATATASRAVSRFDNKYTSLDGLLQRKYGVGEKIQFYPGMGAKGVWFSQDQKITFTGGEIDASSSYFEKVDERFRGAGPKFALNSNWEMGYGFGFYANAAASLLFGNVHSTYKQEYTLGADYKVKFKESFNRTVPALETNFGIEWKYTFEDVAQALGINLGFDGQYFFNEYVNSRIEGENIYAGVGFYGISFGAFWEF